MGTFSNLALGGAALLVAAVALGFAPVKPWLFVAAGAGALGFFIQPPAQPVVPGA